MGNMAKQIGYYLEYSDHKYDKDINEELFFQLEQADEVEYDAIVTKIIENNCKFPHSIIRNRYGNAQEICQRLRVTYDDLYSTCMHGLMKAIYTFNPHKGFKFATYSARCMHNELGIFMRKHKRSFTDTSMERVLNTDDEGSELTLVDLLMDDRDEHSEILEYDFAYHLITELEKTLKPRDITILRMYIQGEMTHSQIGKQLGISQSYISRILSRILKTGRNLTIKLGGA